MSPFRTFLAAATVIGTAALTVPGDAEAGRRHQERIAHRLDRVEVRVGDLREIERPRVRLGEIDRLQAILDRLERRNGHERGRLARYNGDRIDALQSRLARIERRTERRLRHRHGGHGRGYGGGYYGGGYHGGGYHGGGYHGGGYYGGGYYGGGYHGGYGYPQY